MTAKGFSLWKSMKLRHKFTLVASMFTLVLAGLIAVNVLVIESQRTNAHLGEMAARQRMLSQKFVKEVLLSASGVPAEPDATMANLKDTLEGMSGTGGGGMGAMVAAAPTDEIRTLLAEQLTILGQLNEGARKYLSDAGKDSGRPAQLKDLLAIQARLSANAEEVARLYNAYADNRIESTIFFQIGAGLLAALIGIVISAVISRQIADPLADCAGAAREIARGNLHIDPQKIHSGDEIGTLQLAFNEMLASLREISAQTRSVCDSLTMAAAQILASTQEQAAGTKQQAAAVQQITSTVEEISLSGKQVAERARQVAGTAEAVAASGSAGLQAVRDASVGMEAIREQAETVAENIVTLSERTQAVGEIIATVNDIAEQSNLVALNAAIEAADAREQGRRFSVVANEIKNLADQAKEATSQVRGILEQTQKGINTSVMLTEEALKRVETGHERTSVSEQVIRQMANNIEESVHAFQQIVGATNQQQIGLEQVTQALHEIRHASQQTATTTQQLEKASIELTQLGGLLSKTLEKYRL
ncbi:MAG: methyl-accepting chemotaxis protein [Magnetospirillum sp.]|nr:methyl-accepting chemotaxis protein [Magnetospirillum sp.]